MQVMELLASREAGRLLVGLPFQLLPIQMIIIQEYLD